MLLTGGDISMVPRIRERGGVYREGGAAGEALGVFGLGAPCSFRSPNW